MIPTMIGRLPQGQLCCLDACLPSATACYLNSRPCEASLCFAEAVYSARGTGKKYKRLRRACSAFSRLKDGVKKTSYVCYPSELGLGEIQGFASAGFFVFRRSLASDGCPDIEILMSREFRDGHGHEPKAKLDIPGGIREMLTDTPLEVAIAKFDRETGGRLPRSVIEDMKLQLAGTGGSRTITLWDMETELAHVRHAGPKYVMLFYEIPYDASGQLLALPPPPKHYLSGDSDPQHLASPYDRAVGIRKLEWVRRSDMDLPFFDTAVHSYVRFALEYMRGCGVLDRLEDICAGRLELQAVLRPMDVPSAVSSTAPSAPLTGATALPTAAAVDARAAGLVPLAPSQSVWQQRDAARAASVSTGNPASLVTSAGDPTADGSGERAGTGSKPGSLSDSQAAVALAARLSARDAGHGTFSRSAPAPLGSPLSAAGRGRAPVGGYSPSGAAAVTPPPPELCDFDILRAIRGMLLAPGRTPERGDPRSFPVPSEDEILDHEHLSSAADSLLPEEKSALRRRFDDLRGRAKRQHQNIAREAVRLLGLALTMAIPRSAFDNASVMTGSTRNAHDADALMRDIRQFTSDVRGTGGGASHSRATGDQAAGPAAGAAPRNGRNQRAGSPQRPRRGANTTQGPPTPRAQDSGNGTGRPRPPTEARGASRSRRAQPALAAAAPVASAVATAPRRAVVLPVRDVTPSASAVESAASVGADPGLVPAAGLRSLTLSPRVDAYVPPHRRANL